METIKNMTLRLVAGHANVYRDGRKSRRADAQNISNVTPYEEGDTAGTRLDGTARA